MKKIKTSLLALSCLFLLGGVLVACNNDTSSATEPPSTEGQPTGPSAPVENISVTITNGDTASLKVDDTLQLDVAVNPTTASVTYSSSNNDVATVSNTGLVTAVSAGEATITAASGDARDTIVITVTEKQVEEVPVAEIKLKPTSLEMEVGDSATKLAVIVYPDEATDKSLTWASDKTDVATVDNEGNVTAVAPGSCTITATSVSTPNVSASCAVTVKAKQVEIEHGKFGLFQANLNGGEARYFTGKMDGYYLETTSDYSAAVDVYSYEAGEGQVYLRIGEDGQYIGANHGLGDDGKYHNNIVITDEAYAWNYDETYDAYTTTLGEDSLFIGTQGDKFFDTLSLSYYDNIATSFVAHVVQEEITGIPAVGLNLTSDLAKIGIGQAIELSVSPVPSSAILDGEVTYEITSGSEFADLADNVLTGKAAGQVTVVARCGELTSNELTIEVVEEHQEIDYSIGQVKDVNTEYIIRGIVDVMTTSGMVITDGKDSIYYHDNNAPDNYKVGDYVQIEGKPESYNQALQFSYKSTVTLLDEEPTITSPTAIALTKEVADSWVHKGSFLPTDIKKYTWSAVAGKEGGNYFTFNFEGSNTLIEAQYYPNTSEIEVGATYTVTAYFGGYSSYPGYAAIFIAGLEKTADAELTDLTITGPVSVLLNEQITLNATAVPSNVSIDGIVWSIESGEEIVSISPDGASCVVTGNAVGQAVIKAAVGDISKTYNVSVVDNIETTEDITYDLADAAKDFGTNYEARTFDVEGVNFSVNLCNSSQNAAGTAWEESLLVLGRNVETITLEITATEVFSSLSYVGQNWNEDDSSIKVYYYDETTQTWIEDPSAGWAFDGSTSSEKVEKKTSAIFSTTKARIVRENNKTRFGLKSVTLGY